MKTNPTLWHILIATSCLFGLNTFSDETRFKSAVINEVRNDAKLYTYDNKKGESVRPAQVKDVIYGDRSIRLGKSSRAEIEFNDKSIARLGANTIFSFKTNTRQMTLEKGTALIEVPKGHGNTQIATPAATCSIVGTTILLQHIQLPSGGYRSVNVVMEGLMKVEMGGKTYNVTGGSALVSGGSGQPPAIIKVDVGEMVKTSLLCTEFPELKNNSEVQTVINAQKGIEIDPNNRVPAGDHQAVGRDAIGPKREDLVRALTPAPPPTTPGY